LITYLVTLLCLRVLMRAQESEKQPVPNGSLVCTLVHGGRTSRGWCHASFCRRFFATDASTVQRWCQTMASHSAPKSPKPTKLQRDGHPLPQPSTGPEATKIPLRGLRAHLRPETHPTDQEMYCHVFRPSPPFGSGLADPTGSPTQNHTTKLSQCTRSLFTRSWVHVACNSPRDSGA
jgi:hypothetical protein